MNTQKLKSAIAAISGRNEQDRESIRAVIESKLTELGLTSAEIDENPTTPKDYNNIKDTHSALAADLFRIRMFNEEILKANIQLTGYTDLLEMLPGDEEVIQEISSSTEKLGDSLRNLPNLKASLTTNTPFLQDILAREEEAVSSISTALHT